MTLWLFEEVTDTEMDGFEIYKGIQVNSQDFLALEVSVHSVTVALQYGSLIVYYRIKSTIHAHGE